ncbi:eukaryotic translation initiation factor 4 gamma 3-like isoform X6, partial [Leptotrombidium deliense]
MSQGKAVAALTVRKFLTWLKEGEEDQSDFLNLFQSAPESMKPLTLSKSDVINDILVSKREPNEWYSSHSNAGFGLPADEFLPHFIHNPSRNNQNQRSSSQRQIHLRPSQQDRTVRKIISLSPTQGVKLHTVDNAWKPATKGTESSDEEAKTSELLKAFRSILNKLTPRKYQNLLEEVKKFTIDTEVRLQGILELIFDKAVDEPALCLLCANLCKHLALSLKEANIGSDENGIDKKFTPLLLTRCQKEFESKMYEGIDVEEKQAIIDETTDEEKRKMLRAELDEEK